MTEPRRRHEADTLALRPVVTTLLVTAVAVPLISLLLWVSLKALIAPPAPDTGPPPPAMPPGQPRLQTDPPREYAHYHRRFSERLNTLGWVDRAAGIVHIPINEAMTRLLEQGLSGQGDTQTDEEAPP